MKNLFIICILIVVVSGCKSQGKAQGNNQVMEIFGVGQNVKNDIVEAEKAALEIVPVASTSAKNSQSLANATEKAFSATQKTAEEVEHQRHNNETLNQQAFKKQQLLERLDDDIQQKKYELLELNGHESSQMAVLKKDMLKLVQENTRLSQTVEGLSQNNLDTLLKKNVRDLNQKELDAVTIYQTHQYAKKMNERFDRIDKMVSDALSASPKQSPFESIWLELTSPALEYWKKHGGKTIIILLFLFVVAVRLLFRKRIAQKPCDPEVMRSIVGLVGYLEPYASSQNKRVSYKTQKFIKARKKLFARVQKVGTAHPKLLKKDIQKVFLTGEAARKAIAMRANSFLRQLHKGRCSLTQEQLTAIINDCTKSAMLLGKINASFKGRLSH